MTFQQRLILLVTGLVLLAVVAVTAAMAWTTHAALTGRIETEARLAAGLLARGGAQTRDIPQEVDALLSERLLSEATLTAHLVALAEAAKQSPRAINDRLKQIAEAGGPDEMWVTDNRGRAYLHNQPGPDPTFGQDAKSGPRHAAFANLLNRQPTSMVTEPAMENGRLMKFAGVAGVDRPRIVQVGADVGRLGDIVRRSGTDGLIDGLLAARAVEAAWLLDRDGRVLARGAVVGDAAARPLSEAATAAARTVALGSDMEIRIDSGGLLALAPVRYAASAPAVAAGSGAAPAGSPAVAVVRLPYDEPGAMVRRQLKIGGLLAAAVLALGFWAATRFARDQMAPVERLSEAVKAAEAGRFNPFTLNEAADRDDEFGRLSRIFRRMAMEATAREETLDAQLVMRAAELETKSEKLSAAEHLIEEEQRAARDVQTNLLPRQLPAGRDSQFFGTLLPAHAVSGDFYDVVELDDRHSLLLVAGVSGGGVPAAFLMLMVRGALREMARPGLSPAAILAVANDRLCGESPFNGFASAFAAVYDRQTGTLVHAAAGHRGACRVGVDGTVQFLTTAGGPALGVRRGASYAEASVVLNQDEALFLCTDGILRSADGQHEPFGEERLAAALALGRGMSARDRAEVVLRSVQAHAGTTGVIAGDLVCLVMRRLLPVEGEAEAAEAAAV
ncbi:PP2C family protein-serine/threonine phosphatase [Azospirillum picis]|uniref:Sigma-B regulation protein RsbU (Phosphoserine phosphatase) n=1 Tax=Azospirillum picis TaxID=488438 RepID=A0ABU0MIF6_9PROT|nr:SpoIIE family protein phosphatase [Azospirillum picis]MBP2299323.1 sigma-B regulation protein RsbU (phosphoserine phosphatase) [Azospirillum picis]MDQ0533039.1 sigma-B regulation protein RsbU (phosphoserine phosphatase) [Azospirillum picis]